MSDYGRQTASNAKLERELKAAREENTKLRQDLNETRSLYNQLVNESSHETFDERRVNLLKAQIIQLERQVMILSEALSSKSAVTVEVENALLNVADSCRSWIAQEQSGPSVSVARSALTKMVQNVESTRIRLYKNNEDISSDNVHQLPLFTGQYVKANYPITLLDICSGRLDHLNLKHVAKLESKLCSLYKQQLCLLQSLTTVMSRDPNQPTSDHVIKAANERLVGHVARSCDMLMEACEDLLALSVLVPAAPWPPLSKNFLTDLTVERVISTLPSFPRSKQKEGRELVHALIKALNYTTHIQSQEARVCKEELKFHQSLYQLQVSYAESLFEVVRNSYVQFEESTQEMLCQPIRELLLKFDKLKETANEAELREFLACFKNQAQQLHEMIAMLTREQDVDSEGVEALSQFGQQFFTSLNAVKQDCQRQRDEAASQLDIVKADMEEHNRNSLLVFQKEALQPEEGGGGDQMEKLDNQETKTNPASVKDTSERTLSSRTDIKNTDGHDIVDKLGNMKIDEDKSTSRKVVKKPPTPKSSSNIPRRSSSSSPGDVVNSTVTNQPVRTSLKKRASSLENVRTPSPSGRSTSHASSQRPLSGSMSKLKLKPGNPKKKPEWQD